MKSLELYLSYKCDQKCVFCSESSRMKKYGNRQPGQEELLAVMIRKRKEGYEHITFVGGEPTIHPSFLKILRSAKILGYRTLVITDGQRLARENFAQKALPLIDELVFSVHGPSEKIHDSLTATPGSFGNILKSLSIFKEAAHCPEVSISSVLTRDNFFGIEELLRLFSSYSVVRHFLISNLTPNETEPISKYLERVVRLEQIRAKAPEWVRLAQQHGRDVRFLGIPACVLGEVFPYSADFHQELSLSSGRTRILREHGLDLEDSRRYGPQRMRAFPDLCCHCSLKGKTCLGVSNVYIQHFGAGELNPVSILLER